MSNSLFYLAISLLLYAVNLLLPVFMKRSILFGVRLIPGSEKAPFVKALKQRFRLYLSVLFLGYVSVTFLLLDYHFSETWFTFFVLGQIGLSLGSIFYFNRKALHWKTERAQNLSIANDTVVIDTHFRQGKFIVTPWWFLMPFGLVLGHFIFVNVQYDRFPQRLAMHYNFQGHPDRFIQKSWWVVNRLPFISLGMVLLMLGIYYVIKRSKQEIDPSDPKTSLVQDRKFRLYWSAYVVFVATVMSLNFFYLSYAALLGFVSVWLIWLAPALIVVTAIVLALYTGQSGYRLRTKASPGKREMKALRDDDRYWIGGLFYCNKKDPALFVEKRIGVGWTINICNFWAVLILVLILLVIILPALL